MLQDLAQRSSHKKPIPTLQIQTAPSLGSRGPLFYCSPSQIARSRLESFSPTPLGGELLHGKGWVSFFTFAGGTSILMELEQLLFVSHVEK